MDPAGAAAEGPRWWCPTRTRRRRSPKSSDGPGIPDIAQVLLLSRTLQPLGQRRYWPIYEAATKAGLPVGIHAFGNGGHPVTSGRLAEFSTSRTWSATRNPARRC